MGAAARLDYLPAERSFLEPDRPDAGRPEVARAVVIPFGLEATVSYGAGTAKGPAAILAASHQLELYDEELGREPCADFGIAAIAEPDIARPVAAALDQLEAIVETVVAANRFPLVLGGEHALTIGAVRPLVRRHPDLVILQFDAHADLRDGYQGEHNSHAAAMRRVLDHPGVTLVSVGVRAISAAEAAFLESSRSRIQVHWAKDQARWALKDIVAPLAGRPVYVSFDIDALDGAIMPATGTPTPGGLGYWQALAILRRAAEVSRIVAADLVELAPIPGLHVCDYTAAALAYKIMSYALAGAR
ncbi:MAG TPA: agmatinase [Hyphomicrobiaceae bacterium]|nr:agmatinase [Hyphomicrobiaceae bacterium]